MSERENLHIVQRIYQAIVEGYISTRVNLVTDDSDLTFFGSEKDSLGRELARKGWTRWIPRQDRRRPEFQVFSPNEFIAAGNNVVVLGHEKSRVRASGRIVDASWAHVWMVRAGLISRHLEYSDRAAWEAGFDAPGV